MTHKQTSLSALLDRLGSLAPLRPPATEEAIGDVERRLGIRVSSEFREAYLRLNGTLDGTAPENGWFELWPLGRWYTVEEYVQDWPEPHRVRFKDISAAIVFADYSIESWHYAVHFPSDVSMPTVPIYLLHRQPYLVANSLEGFLAAALVDDPEIYPPHVPASYSNFHLYVVSAFRRTRHGPAKAGHYVQKETALIIEYGPESPTTIAWDDAAAERMKKIPAFVRGWSSGTSKIPAERTASAPPRPRSWSGFARGCLPRRCSESSCQLSDWRHRFSASADS